jgi:hypothetical protein
MECRLPSPNGDGRIVARISFSQSGEDPEKSIFTAPFHLGSFCHPRPTCDETNGQNFPSIPEMGMHACFGQMENWKPFGMVPLAQ